jgi:hypothetical protein
MTPDTIASDCSFDVESAVGNELRAPHKSAPAKSGSAVRFAGEYRDRFGESPSETLRRSARGDCEA